MKVLRSPFVAVAGAAWLLCPAVVALLAPGEARTGLLAGWAVAGITGLTSFGLLAYAEERPFAVFMKAILVGFGARLAMVGLGLWVALRRGYDPIWFCVSFFGLYWLFFACEIMALRRMLRGRALPAGGVLS